MGKRAKSNPAKSVKSHKLKIMKMAPPARAHIKPKGPSTHTDSKGQRGRFVSEFDQQMKELQQRSIGQKKTGVKRIPILPIKEATFRLPEPNVPDKAIIQQAPSISFIDGLLAGERTKQKVDLPKPKRSSATYNPFELLENDELLEDGTHSILKMNLKPATFELPKR